LSINHLHSFDTCPIVPGLHPASFDGSQRIRTHMSAGSETPISMSTMTRDSQDLAITHPNDGSSISTTDVHPAHELKMKSFKRDKRKLFVGGLPTQRK